jgi:acyl-CoA dehydrogenase
MGQRGALTADVTFEDCRVPAAALLGDSEGTGFTTSMRVLDDARIHMGAVCVGLATRLCEEMTAYAALRRQFNRAIADFQLVQAMIADSETEAFAARAMVEKAAAMRDAGEKVTKQAAASKYFASEAMWRIADRAVQVHGGYGYVAESAVERLFRDARLMRIFEGTSQIMQLVIARETMKQHAA